MRMLVLPLLAGCSNTISGSVDGEPVGGARTAIYDEVEVDLGIFGDYQFFRVFVTDIPQACEFWNAFLNVELSEDCDETCLAYQGVADEYLGADDYYNLDITIRVDGLLEDEYEHRQDLGGEDTFAATYTDFDIALIYDVQACEDECQDGDPIALTDEDVAQSGTIELQSWEESLEGRYDIGFGGQDALSGRFTAERCNMDNWVWWL